jgi:hypothetical protein
VGGAVLAEGVGDAAHGLLGDVLVERAGGGAGGEDALDGVMVEGAEAGGVGEGGVEIGGGEALAEQEDLAGVMSPEPRRPRAHQAEESGGVIAEMVEGDAELIEVDGAGASGAGVKSGRIEPEPLAARGELVARDAGEVGGVDEELALGDADGQDVRYVVVGHGVGVAFPGDEAVDGAEAIEDTRRVVRMARQRHEMLSFPGKTIKGCFPMTTALIDDGVEPACELRFHVVEIDEGSAIEKGAFDLPEATLDAGLGIGVATHGTRSIFVIGGKGQEARVVDGLLSFPAQHHGFLAVVRAGPCAALESREGVHVPVQERRQVDLSVQVDEFATRIDEHIREGLDLFLVTIGKGDLVRGPIALGHLPGTVLGRRETGLRARRRSESADRLLDGRVASDKALFQQRLEDTLCGDVGIASEDLDEASLIGIDLGGTGRP